MKKLLLVEDNYEIRELAAEFLRQQGFDVAEAGDSDEAANIMVGASKFDAILIDVRMPGRLDGIDFAELVRNSHPDMPILVCSGYAAQLSPRLAALGPPTSFLPKPYVLAEMGEIMDRMAGHA